MKICVILVVFLNLDICIAADNDFYFIKVRLF